MANWQLKKTQTKVGTTSSPSLWTYKQIVYQYWDTENNNYLLTNQSRVVVETYLGRSANSGSAQSYGGDASTSVKVDNTTKNEAITPIYGDVWISAGGWSSKPLVTQTFTVSHASDGAKTISVNSSMSTSQFSPNSASASDSVTLVTIPRGSEFASGTSAYVNGSNIDGGMTIRITKHVDSFYDRLVVGYFNVSQNQWIDNFKTVNNILDGDTLTFTSTELDTLYSTSVPNTVAGIRLYLYSYTDNTYTTVVNSNPSTWIVSGRLNIVAPTFSDFDYFDTNTNATTGTTRLTQDNQTIIKGYSTLKVAIPTSKKATAGTRQTAISHYVVDGNTLTYSSSAEVSMSFSNYSKDNISVYAVDARSTASSVVNKSFAALNKYVNYTNIVKDDTQSYSRSDSGVGEFVTLSFSGTWWGNRKFGSASNAVTNSLSATYKYRVSGSSTWSSSRSITLTLGKAQSSDTYYTTFSYNGIVNGDLSTNGFDVGNSYDIMVIVKDELSSVTYNFSVHSGEPAIALYKNKAALGAKYDETLGGTQIWGSAYLNGQPISSTSVDVVYPVGSIYLTVDATVNPNNIFSGTTWVQIKDKFLLAAGDTYTNGNTGGSATVTLTTNEIPSHNHWERIVGDDGSSNPYVRAAGTGSEQGVYFHGQSAWVASTGEQVVTNSVGGGQAHDNMPPYLVVCVWKRTA